MSSANSTQHVEDDEIAFAVPSPRPRRAQTPGTPRGPGGSPTGSRAWGWPPGPRGSPPGAYTPDFLPASDGMGSPAGAPRFENAQSSIKGCPPGPQATPRRGVAWGPGVRRQKNDQSQINSDF